MNSKDMEKNDNTISIPIESEEQESTEEDLIEQKDSLQEYIEQLQRLQAEFNNYRRRTEKEKESLSTFVKGNLISNLLPVLDDLDLLVQHHQEDHQCPVEAIQIIVQKIKKVFFDEGLESIEALNHSFDPEFNEAVAVEELSDPEKEGVILEEWQKGYLFQGNLLRASRVKVAKLKSVDESE